MSENLFNADIEIGQFVILKHIKNEASYLSRTEASEHSEVLSILRLENHGKVLIVNPEPIAARASMIRGFCHPSNGTTSHGNEGRKETDLDMSSRCYKRVREACQLCVLKTLLAEVIQCSGITGPELLPDFLLNKVTLKL